MSWTMGNKILIADDETDIVIMLKGFFEKRGYEVYTAVNGKEAVKQAERQPEIILLDINMPKMDGLAVCERIRKFVACLIIFLTARIDDTDKIKGFAVGGDDYVVKPFSLMELAARVEAHLRREQRHMGSLRIKFDDELSIDYSARMVYFHDQEIPFVKKEFDIIELLSQNAGQVFDRERIYERIWGYNSDGDSSVISEHIRRIRMKFAGAGCRSYIDTIWGSGYKWVR